MTHEFDGTKYEKASPWYMTIFVHGKQKRVKRPPTIEGMSVDEFIRRNADPIWLHQNEMWEYLMPDDEANPQQPRFEGSVDAVDVPF